MRPGFSEGEIRILLDKILIFIVKTNRDLVIIYDNKSMCCPISLNDNYNPIVNNPDWFYSDWHPILLKCEF